MPPWLAGLVLLLCACGQSEKIPPPETGFTLPYQLDKPDTSFKLPHALREISGLGLSKDGRELLAVNDEQGLVFFLDIETGAVNRKLDFGKSKDYEGVEAVGDEIFVVNSSGSIFQITPDGKTKRHSTPLDSRYDVEGLCYDSSHHRLLLACKGRASEGKMYRNHKAIYAFDLKTMKLEEKPAFTISRMQVSWWKGGSGSFYARLNEFFATDQAPSAFSPSGLAVCPTDGNLYVVAAVGRALAVLHPDGRLLYVGRLDGQRLPQPEGICFDRRGRMFISTEGKNGAPGRIFRFK